MEKKKFNIEPNDKIALAFTLPEMDRALKVMAVLFDEMELKSHFKYDFEVTDTDGVKHEHGIMFYKLPIAPELDQNVFNEQLTTLQSRVKELEHELKSVNEDYRELNKQYNRLDHKQANEIQQLTAEVEGLRGELKEHESKVQMQTLRSYYVWVHYNQPNAEQMLQMIESDFDFLRSEGIVEMAKAILAPKLPGKPTTCIDAHEVPDGSDTCIKCGARYIHSPKIDKK